MGSFSSKNPDKILFPGLLSVPIPGAARSLCKLGSAESKPKGMSVSLLLLTKLTGEIIIQNPGQGGFSLLSITLWDSLPPDFFVPP